MLHKINLVAILICFTQFLYAESLPDSLNRVLTRKDLPLKERITTMGLLARALCVTDIERSMKLEKEAMQLCNQLNDAATTSYIWSIKVLLSYYHGKDIPQASLAADTALIYARQSNNNLAMGIAWYRKAWAVNLAGKTKEAVDGALTGLKYLAGTGGYTYEASLYYILAGAHAELKDHPQQEKYARLCLAAAEKSGDCDNLIVANQALAVFYNFSYKNDSDNPGFLDSAFHYYRQSIHVYKAHPEKVVFKSGVAVTALNVAGMYQQYKVGNYKDSVPPYLDFALKTALETNQTAVIAASFGIMSDIEIEKGNYQKAESLLLAGLAALPGDSVNNNRNKLQILEGLINLEEKTGAYEKALKYYKEYHSLFEAFYDADKLKATKELEEKYQSEQKEQAIQALHEQNKLNRQMKYLYAFIALLIVIAALLVFRAFHFRLRASQHKQQLLQQEKEDALLQDRIRQQEIKQLAFEKQEAELIARLKEQETLRLLAEQKLQQEREERLQKDLLAANLQVERKDELLQTVQKKIEESTDDRSMVKKINNIIDQNKKSDDAFASNKADFDTIRPEFFQQLKEKSGDKMSRLDLKHCAYISLGLTNKEIAQRLSVAPKSILMARYRIKIKLGLTKDDDLDAFIANLS